VGFDGKALYCVVDAVELDVADEAAGGVFLLRFHSFSVYCFNVVYATTPVKARKVPNNFLDSCPR